MKDMKERVRFTKMHGAGNDYIYVNTMLYGIPDPAKASRVWSCRHTGIGADGLVLIGKPQTSGADFSMRIFNADGSEAMMCGNASRCIGKYVYERGLADAGKTQIKLETLSGIKTLDLHVQDGRVCSVTVDMLAPRFEDENQFLPQEGPAGGIFVSMGNPHFVIFTDNVDTAEELGPGLEKHPAFPQRCNIEFASILGNGDIRVRVWERGSGITMACGTGACATAVAAAVTGRAGRKSRIIMDGGILNIEWKESDGHVYLTGPAEFVFDGETGLPA